MNSQQPSATLIWRPKLTEALLKKVQDYTVVGLYGPPGSGKTALLIRLLHPQQGDQPINVNMRIGRIVFIHIPRKSSETLDDPLVPVNSAYLRESNPNTILADVMKSHNPNIDISSSPFQDTDKVWMYCSSTRSEGEQTLLLIDNCDELSTKEWDWIQVYIFKWIIESPESNIRVICAQRTRFGWHQDIDGYTAQMEIWPFSLEDIKQYIHLTLKIEERLDIKALPFVLDTITAGFPLALDEWRKTLAQSAHQNSADTECTDPTGSEHHLDDINLVPELHKLTAEVRSIVLTAGLLRVFDETAIEDLLKEDSVKDALSKFIQRDTQAYGSSFSSTASLTDYLKARRFMQHFKLVNAANNTNRISIKFRNQVRSKIDDEQLLHRVNQCIATHYKNRLENDSFRYQSDLLEWLYFIDIKTLDNQFHKVFDRFEDRIKSVIANDSFADVRVISEFYTDGELLAALEQSRWFERIDNSFSALIDGLSEVLQERRKDRGHIPLIPGQEYQRDGRVRWATDPLSRVCDQAFTAVLRRVNTGREEWEIRFQDSQDILNEEFEYSRRWLIEDSAGKRRDLYQRLRKANVFVGSSTISLSPMIRKMFHMDRTLLGSIDQKKNRE